MAYKGTKCSTSKVEALSSRPQSFILEVPNEVILAAMKLLYTLFGRDGLLMSLIDPPSFRQLSTD
jgi:hypothetical protein